MADDGQTAGPPRKTTTQNRFSTMASENERYNTKQDEFFWLENIMRVAPHKLHSVPGPGSPTHFPQTLPPAPCTDNTERGQQVLTSVLAFEQITTMPPDTNLRTSWSYVSPTGDLQTAIGIATCGGGNMYYVTLPSSNCCQINQFVDDVSTLDSAQNPPPYVVPGSSNFSNTRLGVADQPLWGASSNLYNGMIIYRDGGLAGNTYTTPTNGAGGHNDITYACKGDDLYIVCYPDSVTKIRRFSLSTGSIISTWTPFVGDEYCNSAVLIDGELVCLVDAGFIVKLDPDTGAELDRINIVGLGAHYIFAVNPNLVYFICDGNPGKFYYWDGTQVVYVGFLDVIINPFSGTGFFTNGKFYYGGDGFSGFGVDVQRVDIGCPPEAGPLIASVEAMDSTVAAGAAINVEWADLLQTSTDDRIKLYVAPPAGEINFDNSTALASQTTSAQNNGTISFTIPGGTTPGDYVFRLQRGDGILIATSPNFAVT